MRLLSFLSYFDLSTTQLFRKHRAQFLIDKYSEALTRLSDYATKVFGFATFGRIYGTIVCVSGLINFSQSGLDALTHGPLGGDPTPVNITLGAAGTVVGLILTVFVAIKGRTFVKEEKPALDAMEERQRLLSTAGQDYGTRE